MKFALVIAASGMVLAATAANAQVDTPVSATGTGFRGLRAEAQVGGDRFQSQGTNNNKFGYGGAIGFDGQIGDKIVVGPEASFWRANEWTSNRTVPTGGGVVDHKSFEEWGAAVRAGYLVTPAILVYAKGGYVSNKFRKNFVPASGVGGYNDVDRASGYQVGGGVEYSLSDNFYVNGEYKYSNYANNTARQRALVGFGVRFNPGF